MVKLSSIYTIINFKKLLSFFSKEEKQGITSLPKADAPTWNGKNEKPFGNNILEMKLPKKMKPGDYNQLKLHMGNL